MNDDKQRSGPVAYTPCPPEEFAGRFGQKEEFLNIVEEATHSGQVIMVSGARGSGKSSFLKWAEYEIQNNLGDSKSPAIFKEFMETPGMIFTTYRDLVRDLKGHQKFGWFRKTVNHEKVKNSIGSTLELLDKASSLAGPAKPAVDVLTAPIKGVLPTQTVEYTQLLSSFLSLLDNLSNRLTHDNRFLAILLDDVQWSTRPDFRLLKDLIRLVPKSIAVVAAFRLEAESMDMYSEVRGELDRFGYHEIRLSGMASEEIEDFAKLRYDLAIDHSTAQFLSQKIGDPLCLVSCFNLLEKRGLSPTLANFEKIVPEAVNPTRCIYAELDKVWKDRANSLCILHPPLPLSLIACMLGVKSDLLKSLQDELNQSAVFTRLKKEEFDFAHASLREYCRKELPESMKVGLHSRAAECLEKLRERLPDKSRVVLSLAEHLFLAQEYEKALELNLRLGDRLYDLFDYGLALELTERAQICAEETANKDQLGAALHQKAMILQSAFQFDDALAGYQQSLEISREIGNRAGEAQTLHQIGMVYELTNRFKEALDFYNQSLKIVREIGNRAGEATTLHQIGMVHELTNRFKEALDFYNQSLKIVREIGDRAGEAQTLHQIGRVHELTNRFKEALDFYNQSLEIKREIGDRALEATTLHQIGRVHELTNRFKEALDFYNQSLKIVREIGDRAGEATTLHQIGRVHELTNRFKEALDFYNQSLKIVWEIGDRALEATTLHQIGMVHELTNRFKEALDFYNQSLKIERELGNKSGEEISLQAIKELKEKMQKKKGKSKKP